MGSKYQVDVLSDKQVHQGDIFKEVSYYESYKEDTRRFELALLKFPYAIILSQECDLDNNSKERSTIDWSSIDLNDDNSVMARHDKYLVSLLCAPLYNAEHLFAGNHLSELKIESEIKNSKQREFIKSNRDPRYHYVEFEESVKIVPLIIDFKHYFTVSILELEASLSNRVCSVRPLFREAITQRFSNFLSRIGLPEPKNSE